MRIIEQPVKLSEIWDNKESDFDELLKFVIDVKKGIIALDAEMHADLEK